MSAGDADREGRIRGGPGMMISLGVTCVAMYFPVVVFHSMSNVDWYTRTIIQENWVVIPGFLAGSLFDQLIEGPSGVLMGVMSLVCAIVGTVVGGDSYAKLTLSSLVVLSLSSLSLVVAIRLL